MKTDDHKSPHIFAGDEEAFFKKWEFPQIVAESLDREFVLYVLAEQNKETAVGKSND